MELTFSGASGSVLGSPLSAKSNWKLTWPFRRLVANHRSARRRFSRSGPASATSVPIASSCDRSSEKHALGTVTKQPWSSVASNDAFLKSFPAWISFLESPPFGLLLCALRSSASRAPKPCGLRCPRGRHGSALGVMRFGSGRRGWWWRGLLAAFGAASKMGTPNSDAAAASVESSPKSSKAVLSALPGSTTPPPSALLLLAVALVRSCSSLARSFALTRATRVSALSLAFRDCFIVSRASLLSPTRFSRSASAYMLAAAVSRLEASVSAAAIGSSSSAGKSG